VIITVIFNLIIVIVFTSMGLPGHRRTSSDKRRRAAHFALTEKTLAECPKCKQPVLPHYVCANCGTYKGRQVLAIEMPKAKKEKG
jgi:large subunit ribosomal protein L32